MGPLIDRLNDEFGWPRLEKWDAFEAFVGAEGEHVVFLPGDVARNLESNDVAVVLPEIVQAFQGRFDAAVIGDEIEYAVRDSVKSFRTPNLLFFRDGLYLGDIPKVRDWSEYVARVQVILSRQPETVGED